MAKLTGSKQQRQHGCMFDANNISVKTKLLLKLLNYFNAIKGNKTGTRRVDHIWYRYAKKN